MLVFVTPLKSAEVAKSWTTVSAAFERSIRSVCRQTCPDFRAIVVCHERPEIGFDDPRIRFVEVDHRPPTAEVDSMRNDKHRKIVAGLRLAREFQPTHTMIVDGDDCVSHRLAGFVKEQPDAPGWYSKRGYLHGEGSERVYLERRRFHRWCGTSNIVRYGIQNLPSGDVPSEDLSLYHWPHTHVAEFAARKGHALTALPFPGSVYMLGHGDNIQEFAHLLRPDHLPGRVRSALFHTRPLTEEIRTEFGVYSLTQNQDDPPVDATTSDAAPAGAPVRA